MSGRARWVPGHFVPSFSTLIRNSKATPAACTTSISGGGGAARASLFSVSSDSYSQLYLVFQVLVGERGTEQWVLGLEEGSEYGWHHMSVGLYLLPGPYAASLIHGPSSRLLSCTLMKSSDLVRHVGVYAGFLLQGNCGLSRLIHGRYLVPRGTLTPDAKITTCLAFCIHT